MLGEILVKAWRWNERKYGKVKADDIARRSLRKNNPIADLGNYLVFFLPNFWAKALSLIIDAEELTTKVSNNFPIKGSILLQFSKIFDDKLEVE